MIRTVVVGYGLAGRVFHCPLILREQGLRLHGIVARSSALRSEAVARCHVRGYVDLDEALADRDVDLVVLATPHDTHAEMAVRTLQAGKHCVVDKVMALSTTDADRMIAARDASGRMLSVFHNRRWDWDFATVKEVLGTGELGRALLIGSSVCRYAPPRTWRGSAAEAGTILHDWGAHLVDQALQLGLGRCRRLAAWITPAPWEGVDNGGHGRIMLEFDQVLFEIETSRICRLERPRWSILGTAGAFVKHGVDPQEDALRAGDLDAAVEPPEHVGHIRIEVEGVTVERKVDTHRESWEEYYGNVAAHLRGESPLAVTAEQAREVVRVLDAARRSAEEHTIVAGDWGADS
jgi:scyllo-inositol 2-dehydrogenase (NADP+)